MVSTVVGFHVKGSWSQDKSIVVNNHQVKVWSVLSGSFRPSVEALMMVLSPSKWKIRIKNLTICENVTADYVTEIVVVVISDVDIARRAATVAKGKLEKPAPIQSSSSRV